MEVKISINPERKKICGSEKELNDKVFNEMKEVFRKDEMLRNTDFPFIKWHIPDGCYLKDGWTYEFVEAWCDKSDVALIEIDNTPDSIDFDFIEALQEI